MARSPGFGSIRCYQFVALFRLAFTVAASAHGLNQATSESLVGSFFNRNAVVVTLRTPFQLHVSIRFQILFHRPPGLLFSFPSLYLFTIGQKEYLALPHRRGCFLRGFSSPVVLRIRNTYGGIYFVYRTITVFGSTFQWIQLYIPTHMLFPWGENVSSTTSLMRQPKLVTSARGQTCVQLGVEAYINDFGSSAFARRY